MHHDNKIDPFRLICWDNVAEAGGDHGDVQLQGGQGHPGEGTGPGV